MSSSASQKQSSFVHLMAPRAAGEHLHNGDLSLKKRLTERFVVPGALVICRRRTIFGTWKACEAPFHIYNLGLGGVNFWNPALPFKPGVRIKLTILIPDIRPIDVISEVVWSRDVPHADSSHGAQQYTQITGVKFVDYDAAAWAVLREVHRVASAGSQDDACSPFAP